MSDFKNDLKVAESAFSLFKESICEHIKGDLISIELENAKLSKMFDQYSGIDAFQLIDNKLRSVALRMQKCQNRAWDTFTIRYKRSTGARTEYEKRTEAVFSDKGFMYPYLTIQAYYNDDTSSLLSFGVVKTEDLYKYIVMNMPNIKKRTVSDGNEMLVVSFKELKNKGVKILYYSMANVAA